MKIQIVGVGVVGGAQAYLASHLGHEVLGLDHHKSSFEYARMVKDLQQDVDLTFICTPESAVEEALGHLVADKVKGVYVIKSTVPPKTTQSLMQKCGIHICHNPEFLVERMAYETVSHPAVVIIGQCCPEHGAVLQEFYRPLGCPVLTTQPTVSETVKLTINSYLATLITFWNQFDKVARALGVETAEVARLAKGNPRISPYGAEFFGAPFGGKCLPKDLDQVIDYCNEAGVDCRFLDAVKEFNRVLDADTV